MNLKAFLLKSLKWFANHLFGAILGLSLALLFAAWSTLFWSSAKDILNYAIQLLSTPTPLWATIALIVLCYLYTYIRVAKFPAMIKAKDQSSSNLPYVVKYFIVDNLKWKTKIFHENHFEVEKIAICLEHDLPLIHENIRYYCPEFLKKNCRIIIDHNEYPYVYATAKSYIDKETRNNKC